MAEQAVNDQPATPRVPPLGPHLAAGPVPRVRPADATWVDADREEHAIFGQPIGVRAPGGRSRDPLGKAVKRYENGPADGRRLFRLAAGARS